MDVCVPAKSSRQKTISNFFIGWDKRVNPKLSKKSRTEQRLFTGNYLCEIPLLKILFSTILNLTGCDGLNGR